MSLKRTISANHVEIRNRGGVSDIMSALLCVIKERKASSHLRGSR